MLKEKILQNEKGQSIFELVVFVPLMLIVLTMMVNTGNAINASINQLKATRAYYYFLLRGNSIGQRNSYLVNLFNDRGMLKVGFNAVGWRRSDEAGSEDTFAVCYKYNSWLSDITGTKTCDDPLADGETKTPFVRIFTVYGLCTETYDRYDQPFSALVDKTTSGRSSACVLQ